MIHRNSRYRNTPVLSVTGPGGRRQELLDLRKIPAAGGVFHYTPTDSDRLDHLAWRFYRDPTRFWRICDGSEQLDPFEVLSPGEPVRVPPNK